MRLIRGPKTRCPLCDLGWRHDECVTVWVSEEDR